MPVTKKVIVRAVMTLDMHSELSVEQLAEEVRVALEQTGQDYGDNVAVTID